MEKKEIRVFFSWQSDSPTETNSGAIRSALKAVEKDLERKHPDTDIVCDEATRDRAGSPNIVESILDKIENAQVYVADITTVNPASAERPSPNPNVLFELGYAVAHLGWDRIILLFNSSIGSFPDDLPFDIGQQRVSPYSIRLTDKASQDAEKRLEKLLEVAVRVVIEKNPKTPIELKGASPETIKHQRDVENLRWLLSQIHIPSLQSHTTDLPHSFADRILWYWESYKGVIDSRLFNIYDVALKKMVMDLYKAWGTTLNFDQHYRGPNGDRYIFSKPGDAPLDVDEQQDWDTIQAAAVEMADTLKALVERVHSSYLAVDIQQTSNEARDAFFSDKTEWRQLLDDINVG